jgi:hypothetical protein
MSTFTDFKMNFGVLWFYGGFLISEEGKQLIIDNTETTLVALRRAIYLTIQSSLDYEECAHKLLKLELKPGQEVQKSYILDFAKMGCGTSWKM